MHISVILVSISWRLINCKEIINSSEVKFYARKVYAHQYTHVKFRLLFEFLAHLIL